MSAAVDLGRGASATASRTAIRRARTFTGAATQEIVGWDHSVSSPEEDDVPRRHGRHVGPELHHRARGPVRGHVVLARHLDDFKASTENARKRSDGLQLRIDLGGE